MQVIFFPRFEFCFFLESCYFCKDFFSILPIRKIKKIFKNASQKLDEIRKNLVNRNETKEKITSPNFKKPEKTVIRVEIDPMSVFKGTLIVFGIIFLAGIFEKLADILILFLIALFFASAVSPTVDFIERKFKISRSIAIILILFVIFGLIIFLIGTLIPIIAEQIFAIGKTLANWSKNVLLGDGGGFFGEKIRIIFGDVFSDFNSQKLLSGLEKNFERISENLANFAEKGMNIVITTFGAIFNFILVLLLSFFLVLDRNNLKLFFRSLFPKKHQDYFAEKTAMVQKKIGEWVHGQIILFFVVGFIAYCGLLVIGVDYALTLAIVAGLAEFVPYVGPLVAFSTAAPIAFSDSVTIGLLTVSFYAFLQILEGNVIVPIVMKKAVGLPPIVTILALIIGASFPEIINPIIGMILAVPVATIVSIFVVDFTDKNR